MNQFTEFFAKLTDSSDWPPRWHCGKWSDFHGWLYIVSDLLIWSAYFAIPLIILKYISKKKNAHFVKLYIFFASFILACGATHFLDAVMFWFPVYRISALVRLITGIISWVTVFNLIKLLPVAFTLRTTKEVETEVEMRKKIEKDLQIQNERYNEAQTIAKMGHWNWDVKANEIVWSDNLFKIFGLPVTKGLTYDKFKEAVHPDDRESLDKAVLKAVEYKEPYNHYYRIIKPGGEIRSIHTKGQLITDDNGEVAHLLGVAQDITDQKAFEEELLNKTKELEMSNFELEKLAFVASHDLQEPLRKIMTFTSLLQKEIKHAQTSKTSLCIEKIEASCERMNTLINDVLDYSRFASEKNLTDKVDLNKVLKEVLNDLEVLIKNNNATIQALPLPVIEANAIQIHQLFQNIITNAIKFRKRNVAPQIIISSEIIVGEKNEKPLNINAGLNLPILNNSTFWQTEKFCRITIKDNGIGFDESYLEKIFVIFQRLHTKTEYEGTGIGLATCKKIVDKHHGIITGKSKPGEGSEFIIVLPVSQKKFTKNKVLSAEF